MVTSWCFEDWHHAAVQIQVPLCLVVQVDMHFLEFDSPESEGIASTCHERAQVVSVEAEVVLVYFRLGLVTTVHEAVESVEL